MKTSLLSKVIISEKINTETGYDSVRELNTKNMGNSPSFLSVTHTILSAKRFRSYRISKTDFAADFCF
jgi:hypothetical protein